MWLLILTAIVAGQPAKAQWEFGQRAACERSASLVVRQLMAERAEYIVAICMDEPAT